MFDEAVRAAKKQAMMADKTFEQAQQALSRKKHVSYRRKKDVSRFGIRSTRIIESRGRELVALGYYLTERVTQRDNSLPVTLLQGIHPHGFFCLSSVVGALRNAAWLRLGEQQSGGGKARKECIHACISFLSHVRHMLLPLQS